MSLEGKSGYNKQRQRMCVAKPEITRAETGSGCLRNSEPLNPPWSRLGCSALTQPQQVFTEVLSHRNHVTDHATCSYRAASFRCLSKEASIRFQQVPLTACMNSLLLPGVLGSHHHSLCKKGLSVTKRSFLD